MVRAPRTHITIRGAMSLAASLAVSLVAGSAMAGEPVEEHPGLNITKVASAEEYTYGDPVIFTITVWNAGPGDLQDVRVTDAPPQPFGMGEIGPTFPWQMSVLNPDADDSCEELLEGEVDTLFVWHCELGTLPVTDSAGGKVLQLVGESSADECASPGPGYSNGASATATGPAGPVQVLSSDTFEIVNCPTLTKEADVDFVTLRSTPDGPIVEPDRITWTLRWAADRPIADASVADFLAPGLTLESASDGGRVDPSLGDGRRVIWDIPPEDTGGEMTYTIRIDPNAVDIGVPIQNGANICIEEHQCFAGASAAVDVRGPDALPTPAPSANGDTGGPLPDTAVLAQPVQLWAIVRIVAVLLAGSCLLLVLHRGLSRRC